MRTCACSRWIDLPSNYYSAATPSSATGCRHPTVDATISRWMPAGHLHGDARRSTLGIHYWMRVGRLCGWSGPARRHDRSATARPFARDFTSHRPALPVPGPPLRQRRRVARRAGGGRFEVVTNGGPLSVGLDYIAPGSFRQCASDAADDRAGGAADGTWRWYPSRMCRPDRAGRSGRG